MTADIDSEPVAFPRSGPRPESGRAAMSQVEAPTEVAPLFTVDRSGFVPETLVYALILMTELTTVRLVPWPWACLAIVGLLVAAFGLVAGRCGLPIRPQGES